MVKRNGRDGEVVCLEATEFPAADVREKQEGGGGNFRRLEVRCSLLLYYFLSWISAYFFNLIH